MLKKMHTHGCAMKHFWNIIGNTRMTAIAPRQFLHAVQQESKGMQRTPTKRSSVCAGRGQGDLGEVVRAVPP